MALSIPMPPEAREALSKTSEMASDIKDIRDYLAELLAIERARIGKEHLDVLPIKKARTK